MNKAFDRFAEATAVACGSPWAFVLSVLLVAVWAASGPLFGYSDTWQMLVNTGTTVITFWMAFIILAASNRDGAAIQLKLDEIIKAMRDADSRLIGSDRLTREEIDELRDEQSSAPTP